MIRLLCCPPGEAFDQEVLPYRRHLLPLVDRLAAAVGRCAALAECPTWREYAVYLRWPIRQLEYAFALEQAAPVLSPGGGCGRRRGPFDPTRDYVAVGIMWTKATG